MDIDSPAHPRDFIVPNEVSRYNIIPRQAPPLKYLQIELTDRFNLTCSSCPRSIIESSNSSITPQQFAALLDDNTDISRVSFGGDGEVLMLKNFAEYVSICSKRGIFSSVNTNGVLIKHCLVEAMEAGLGKVVVSVDSDDDLMRKMRSGVARTRLEESMRLAVSIVAGTPTQLSAAVTLSRMNLHQFPRTMLFIAECGIQSATVESLHHWAEDKSLNSASLFSGEPADIIAQIENGLAAAHGVGLKVEIFDFYRIAEIRCHQKMHCAWPWHATFVTCKGEVTPCCINIEASESNRLGRLSESSLQDIWRGEPYQRFRRDMLSGLDWPCCSDCVYRMEFGAFADE